MEYSFGNQRPFIESDQEIQNHIANLKAVGGREAVVTELCKNIKLSSTQGLLCALAVSSHVPSLVLNSVGETRPLMWVSAGAIIAASLAYGAVNKLTVRRIEILTEAAKIETNN